MSGFYNPTMKGPDWGGGISDIAQRYMMMQMIKKMFGEQGGGTQTTPTSVPQPSMDRMGAMSALPPGGPSGAPGMSMPPPGMPNGMSPGGPSGVPGMQQSPFGNMDPQQLMALMKMLMQNGGKLPGMGV